MKQCCVRVSDERREGKTRRCYGYVAATIDGKDYCAVHAKREGRAALAERALQLARKIGDAYLYFAPGCRFSVRPNGDQMEALGQIAAELAALGEKP
jgi:hypothetical protein